MCKEPRNAWEQGVFGQGEQRAHQGRVLSAHNSSGLVLPESHYFTTSSDSDLYIRISDCFSGRVV